MPVSSDLQAVITRLSIAHAGGKAFGKTELGALGRELCLIRDEAQQQEQDADKLMAAALAFSGRVCELAGRDVGGFVCPPLEAEAAR